MMAHDSCYDTTISSLPLILSSLCISHTMASLHSWEREGMKREGSESEGGGEVRGGEWGRRE